MFAGNSSEIAGVGGLDFRKALFQGCLGCCTAPLGIALLIIGICAAANVMSGVVAGGCAIGLSVPLLLAGLCAGRKDILGNDLTCQIVLTSIIHLAIIIFGALAIAGTLPAASVGYAVLGAAAVNIIVALVQQCCCGGYQQMLELASVMQQN